MTSFGYGSASKNITKSILHMPQEINYDRLFLSLTGDRLDIGPLIGIFFRCDRPNRDRADYGPQEGAAGRGRVGRPGVGTGWGMSIAGVILAAGTSSRMGSTNKLLLRYKNHTVVEEVLEQLSNSQVDDILIITGFESERVEELLAGRLSGRMSFVFNSNYHLGRAESIKSAIRQLKEEAEAALFMVADKPGVSSNLINGAIDRYRKDRPAILYVETPAGRGHPIIFSKALFDDLLALKGDSVGDELVRKYENDVVRLKDQMPQIDIDSKADYRQLLNKEAGKDT